MTLEAAARNRKSVLEQVAQVHQKDESQQKLIEALMDAARGTEKCSNRFTYSEFKMKYGDDIFGEGQPMRALKAVIPVQLFSCYQYRNHEKTAPCERYSSWFFLCSQGFY